MFRVQRRSAFVQRANSTQSTLPIIRTGVSNAASKISPQPHSLHGSRSTNNSPLPAIINDVHPSFRDESTRSKLSTDDSLIRYHEQPNSQRAESISTTESGDIESRNLKSTGNFSSESSNVSSPQRSSAAALPRKQRAIKTASRPGGDRIFRLPPLVDHSQPAHVKDLLAQSPGIRILSSTRQSVERVAQSPSAEHSHQELRRMDLTPDKISATNTLIASETARTDGPAVSSQEQQDRLPPSFVSSEDRASLLLKKSDSQPMDETLPILSPNTREVKGSNSFGFETLGSKSGRQKPLEDTHVHDGSHTMFEEVLSISVGNHNTARSVVEFCLKQQLVDLYESHASLTRSKLWRQRICHESELRAKKQHRHGSASSSLPEKFIQLNSPFEALSPIQMPFDRQSAVEGMPDFSQEIYSSVKPKETTIRSGWVSPTTVYTSTAVSIPAFKEYVSLKNNFLVDNESKLLATPYFQDEDDKARTELRKRLPQQYEMKHDENALSDLRAEQCRFYKDVLESFLRKIDVSWSAVLFWLLAPDRVIRRINQLMDGSAQFEDFLLQRSKHQSEQFTRDEEPQTVTLFSPDTKRWQEFLSQQHEPAAKQLRLSALACAAVLDECGASIWYFAQQSDIMSLYVSRKTRTAVMRSSFRFRDALCRVCHQ